MTPQPAPIPHVRVRRLRWSPFRRDRWRWTVTYSRLSHLDRAGTAYTYDGAHRDAIRELWRG